MKLTELCRGMNISLFCGKKVTVNDIDINDITVDSRRAGKLSVFAPILGYKLNGGDFVLDAYSRGCRVFLSETLSSLKEDCIILKTENIRKSVAELSSKLYDYNSKKVKLIGITGTKGKTTIAFSIAKILTMENISAFSIGTLGVLDGNGKVIEKTENTTPEPTVLYRLINKCVTLGAKVIALEVSSQALKDYRIHGLEFFAVIFSSLGVDHIGASEHENFTEYVKSKRSLFTDYKSDFRILNSDDVYTSYIAFGTEKCIKCGFGERSDYRITDFLFSSHGSSFKLCGEEIKSKLPAKYDVRNLSLAIVASALFLGKKISALKVHIPFLTIPGRFESYNVKGRTFIIDYAHNQTSFASVLTLARTLFDGKIISVFGSVGERSRGRRKELAEMAERYSDFSIITTDNPGYEPPGNICKEIMNFFTNKASCEICVDRERAIFLAYERSLPGDVIMLLGKGHEEEMNIGGQKLPFSERKIIEKIKDR